jgi:fatty-acyl-CoA synthase
MTIADLIRAREGDANPGLLFEDRSWTYAEFVQACAERASLFLDLRRPGPFHVGLLLDNVPEFPMWLGAAAVTGGVVVGVNTTRRGGELERDIRHTDCQLLITEEKYLPLLEGLDLGIPKERVLVVEREAYGQALAPHRGADLPKLDFDPQGIYVLVFTSGTAGAPKAVICSQARMVIAGAFLAGSQQLGPGDVCYQVMPMFHSNALMAGWCPAITGGAASALRRKFSASGFLPDVRRYGVTYFNYVGKPLAYILATPERPDDADNPLRCVFGNEAAERDIARFSERFGCTVTDSYGSSEGAAVVFRVPDMPKGALGICDEHHVVLNSETGEECPRARFDERGRLLNAEEAIGELVNRAGGSVFEGYYKNPEAGAARVRDGAYWTGDLAYRDEKGFFYFAGRDIDWMRVDGENFAGAPIERILDRFPGVVMSAVYAVPDIQVGDQVMAALVFREGESFDPERFVDFLALQSDLGTKWAPRYVRACRELPATQTNKILKRGMSQEGWECDDPVWQRGADGAYALMTPKDKTQLREEFAARDREHVLGRRRLG